MGDCKRVVACGDAAAFVEREKFRLILDADLALFDGKAGVVVDRESFAGQSETVGRNRSCFKRPWARAIEAGGEVELTGLPRREADDNALVGSGAEALAHVADTTVRKGSSSDGGVEVQFE